MYSATSLLDQYRKQADQLAGEISDVRHTFQHPDNWNTLVDQLRPIGVRINKFIEEVEAALKTQQTLQQEAEDRPKTVASRKSRQLIPCTNPRKEQNTMSEISDKINELRESQKLFYQTRNEWREKCIELSATVAKNLKPLVREYKSRRQR